MNDILPWLQPGLLLLLIAAIFWLAVRRPRGADDLVQRLLAVKNDVERLDRIIREDGTAARRGSDERGRLLREEVQRSLSEARVESRDAAGVLQSQVAHSIKAFGEEIRAQLQIAAEGQTRSFEAFTATLRSVSETLEKGLVQLREENAAKLEEMRKTVDEKLQSTLETRLGESFNRVVEQLERVHKGIGEMQTLAAGVGDLKRVLSNVRARGTFGEVQLEMLLEQFLSPEQYIRNAQIKEHSQERVEYAIKFPGRDSEGEVLLPVDAKFPQEDFDRLMIAVEQGDGDGVAAAAKDLESRIISFARDIRDKYLAPPRTTEFGILFLPTEGLYAEILRRPGLFERLQRDYHVTLTGPTTFTALLNAFQMGFRSLAIEKRSGEVWRILGAVQNEFGKYNEVVDRLASQLDRAAKSVENLGTRTRAMSRKLRGVEKLPDADAQILLGPAIAEEEDEPVRPLMEIQ